MASKTTKIEGYAVSRPTGSGLRTDEVAITVKAEFRPASSRAGTEQRTVRPLADGDLVEIEYEDGLRVWLTEQEYRDKLGADGKRDATGADVLEVPDSLAFGGAEAASRGVAGWVLKSLKIVGVDVGKRTALEVAGAFENKTEPPRRPGLGLFRCVMQGREFALASIDERMMTAPDKDKGPGRVLIFLHGTASSTYGSFGELWSAGRAGTLEGLRRVYGVNVFGFEHRSMTVGPIENALELARELDRRLPDGVEVDLISHSRGGLIGELLCRVNVLEGAPPFDADDIRLAGSAEWLETATDLGESDRKEAAAALAKAAGELRKLRDVLARLRQRGIRVRRFVRVACPALGTTLASRRLDKWAQILLNTGSLAAKASPIAQLVDSLGDLLAVLIRQKTRPEVLPGLAAMLPDAGVLRAVNNPTRPVGGDLAVIAGDLEADSVWRRLLTLIADKFYAGEHDLVVNTGSMYGGAPRAGGAGALLSYQQGDTVNHFNYFKNEASATALLRALEVAEFASLEGGDAGFESMRPPVKPIAREVSRGPAGPRPIVFVLPGIMGSELAVGGDKVWMSLPALFLGGLARLRVGAGNVVAKGVYAPYYAELIEYLADTHKVIPFPYDWRLSPEIEARRLAAAVDQAVREASAAGQPVRIVAHSMGGLVARSMIAQHPALWTKMTKVKGARLVMLGTPNGGSHSITQLIVGLSSTIRRLALADVKNGKRALLDVISRFPGVLSLLPVPGDGTEDFLRAETWQAYRKGAGDEWTPPHKEDLEAVRRFRESLAGAVADEATMVYVAGQAPETLTGMYVTSGKVRFKCSNRGDGQVPWDTGIPAGLKAWYMPGVVHGNLPSAEEHFPALLDLLERGDTARLRREEPVSRDAVVERDYEPEVEDALPDEAALAAAALGGPPPRVRRRKVEASPLRVSVMHGHLKFADWPVLVGHYKGDTIISAEKVLDAELDGRLTHRHRLGLYPADVNTCEVVLRRRPRPSNRWRGAIVVGLGPVGELGVGALTSTVARGALSYAVKQSDREFESGDAASSNEVREIGLSALLVGTNAGGVSARDSVLALLDGVIQANSELRAAKRPVRISSLQLVEILQSKALQAVEDLRFFSENSRFRGVFVPPTRLDVRRGARSQLIFKEPEGWWQRLQIKGSPPEGDPQDCALRYVALTRRARAESRLVATQRALVDNFVARTIRSTRSDPEMHRTLFELLLPNALKEQSPNRDNLVLILDEEAARYPWEMLENRLDGNGTPWALNRGLLRQIELKDFRETPVRSLSRKVLVIGDPALPEDGPFKQLPGAREEALAVEAAFRKNGFDVVCRTEEGPAEIVRALFAAPYQVVHLAGHGVYEWPRPTPERPCEGGGAPPASEASGPRGTARHTVTGMVIGKDVFLTPGEIEQMRRVPELVFINCCHLGRIEDRERTDYNRFAANVATQFMRLGVRAVVAAGWAVDDAAAKTFATEFYERMLAGGTFGEAVGSARVATAARHPYSNTWGAFQCYGDPDFFLVEQARGSTDRPPAMHSVEQFINRTEELGADIQSLGAGSVSWYVEQLDKLRDVLVADPGWSRQGRAWAALARVYNAAFRFESAVECYRKALRQEDGGLTVHDIEQLANCECRMALAEWRSSPDAGSDDTMLGAVLGRVERAIGRLDGLNLSSEQDGLPIERLSLVASAHKRRAILYSPVKERSKRIDALRKAMSGYRDAAQREPGAAYPLVHWAAVELVLEWHGERFDASEREELDRQISSMLATLEDRVAEQLDVWDQAALADVKLVQRLRAGESIEQADDKATKDAKIEELYVEARRLANAREFESVLEQLDFLTEMARDTEIGDGKVFEELDRLRTSLGGGRAATRPSKPAKKARRSARPKAVSKAARGKRPAPAGKKRGAKNKGK